VLLIQPESGDDLQWEKAGLLEVADIVAVHKADLPGADQTAAQVRAALDLSSQRQVPVIQVSSKTGAGVETLWKAIESCPQRRQETDDTAQLLESAKEALAKRYWEAVRANHPGLQKLLAQWREGTAAEDVGLALLQLLASGYNAQE
jgi:putative protein kinase ArgK-like GTPase of G3E family